MEETAENEPNEQPAEEFSPDEPVQSSTPPEPPPTTAETQADQEETKELLPVAVETKQVTLSEEPEIRTSEPKETGGERRSSAASGDRRASTASAERRSSLKRSSVAAETLVAPDVKADTKTSRSSRRSSTPGLQVSASEFRHSVMMSGGQRKSKFGGLSSRARMVLGSIVDIKTNVGEAFDRRVAKYQNSYRLESQHPFNVEKVDKILREVMNELIENLHYDPEKCTQTAKVASGLIRTRVKGLDFDRYKLVCIVSIGEKNSQDVYATCRFLWDAEKDRYAYYALENTHVYAIAYCFGLYYE